MRAVLKKLMALARSAVMSISVPSWVTAYTFPLATAARDKVSAWSSGFGVKIAAVALCTAAGGAVGWVLGHASGADVADVERRAHASAVTAHRSVSATNATLTTRLIAAELTAKRLAEELSKRPAVPVKAAPEKPSPKRPAPKPVSAPDSKPMPWW